MRERFGKRMIDEITAADVHDYLSELYYIDGYAYKYTESFLKMFYLFFGQAYSRNYIDVDTYNKVCVNKDTKIKMPKLKSEDDTDTLPDLMDRKKYDIMEWTYKTIPKSRRKYHVN